MRSITQRFPKDDTTHSYLFVNDNHDVEVGVQGAKTLLKDLHWDKLNLEEFQVMGCGTANTFQGKIITESLGQTLQTRTIGNKELYWFHTECMKKSPFLEPLNAPRAFNFRPPRPHAGPSLRP